MFQADPGQESNNEGGFVEETCHVHTIDDIFADLESDEEATERQTDQDSYEKYEESCEGDRSQEERREAKRAGSFFLATIQDTDDNDESEERSVDNESDEGSLDDSYESEERSIDESEASVGNNDRGNWRDVNNNDDDRDIFDESIDNENCPDSQEHNTAKFELECNFDEENDFVEKFVDGVDHDVFDTEMQFDTYRVPTGNPE